MRWAMRALGRREYLPAELRSRLLASGFDEAIADGVIQTLIDQRLLSESRAIEAIVESKSGRRAVGREALREDLRARGVEEEKLEVADRTDEEERALMFEVILRFNDRARAARLLARRGFSEELIGSVLDQRFGEVE